MEIKNSLLSVTELDVVFKMRQGLLTAVKGVSFSLEIGKILAIVGESGSGKSVTARSIMRIEHPGIIKQGNISFNSDIHGSIQIEKLNPKGNIIRTVRWKEIAMVFQEPMTSFGPMHSFGNQMSEALILHEKISKKEALDRVIESMALTGMPRPEKIVKQYPHQISGGMRQRAMIAMALICNPKILIADEPTTALDVSTEAQILQVLKQRQQKLNTSIIYISHNLGVVANIADKVVVMYLGEIVEDAPVGDLFNNPLHPYTQALLEAIPRVDTDYKDKKLKALKGSIPNPYEFPKGCKFHPRCPVAMDICSQHQPGMRQISHERSVACHLFND